MRKILTLFTTLLLLGSVTVVHAEDYYVAGTMNEWKTTDDANKMSLVSGTVYSKTFSALAANTYEFKISTYNWGSDWGGGQKDNTLSNVNMSGDGNISFTTTTACNVTFYFDAGSTKKIYVRAIPTSTTYTIVGDNATLLGTEWDPSETGNDMALQLDGITYEKTYSNVHLAAGKISYKVAADHAWSKTGEYPFSGDYSINIPGEGDYDVTFTYVPSNISLTAVATPLAPPAPATIKMHGNFTGSWDNTAAFALAGNEETASLTLFGISEGTYQFGVRIGSDDNWTSNGSAFTRANSSYAITSGSGNCFFTADMDGDYTFTWTYETNTLSITYPALPEQNVAFVGLAETILKGTEVTFAASSNGITNPSYTYYVKEAGGLYGSAVASYTFNTLGDFVVKVEAEGDNTSSPIVKEANVSVYETHTFTAGSKIYVDFSAMTEGTKDVNYPFGHVATSDPLDYDANGAGTIKTIIFTENVEWSTLSDFIKTAKAGWSNGLKFSVPAAGKNCAKVAADGASYTWDTYVDLTTDFYLVGNVMGWNSTDYRFMKATADATSASTTVNISSYINASFKLKENGEWRGCDPAKTLTQADNSVTILSDAPGNDIGLTPYAAGDYIFTLNLSTRELTVTYPSGDQMPVPSNLYLKGTMNNWGNSDWTSIADDYTFTVSGDVATLSVNLTDSTEFEFKLDNNGTWLGANWNFNYYWNTDVALSTSEGNAKINTFKEGTHTFTYTISTGLLTIGFPATTATEITIGSYEYATLFSAKGFDVPNAVEAYMITGNSGTSLTLERIYNIPANTGVLLHATAGSYDFYEGDSRFMGVDTEDNLLKGTATETVIADNGKIHYVLSYDNSGNVGFFWPNGTGDGIGDFTNGAGKAYLELSSQSAAIIARRGFPLGTEPAEGIDAVKSGEKAVKFIENGQLFILRDGKLYNAQGLIVK